MYEKLYWSECKRLWDREGCALLSIAASSISAVRLGADLFMKIDMVICTPYMTSSYLFDTLRPRLQILIDAVEIQQNIWYMSLPIEFKMLKCHKNQNNMHHRSNLGTSPYPSSSNQENT